MGIPKVKPNFILTPEVPLRERLHTDRCWYPFWNETSGYYGAQRYLDYVLYFVEKEIAENEGNADQIMASREAFLYRTPNTPAEEQFCRGQF